MNKNTKKPSISVIIAAGGASLRMNGQNKLLAMIGDKPVLAHTLSVFEQSPQVDEIVLSAKSELLTEYAGIAEKYGITKLKKVVIGGETRLQSVYNAAIQCDRKADFIAVHDAARPLITENDIDAVVKAAIKFGSSAAGHKTSDTLKKVKDGFICDTVDRNETYSVQTPQMADRDLLLAALKKALDSEKEITDECMALENIGVKPFIAETSAMNIKITVPEDIFLAEAIMKRRKE